MKNRKVCNSINGIMEFNKYHPMYPKDVQMLNDAKQRRDEEISKREISESIATSEQQKVLAQVNRKTNIGKKQKAFRNFKDPIHKMITRFQETAAKASVPVASGITNYLQYTKDLEMYANRKTNSRIFNLF